MKESLDKVKEKRAVNKGPQLAWSSILEGKAHLDFFPDGGANQQGWPKTHDSRHEVPQKMCQVKGACTTGCNLAHVSKSRLWNEHETEISARFKKIYGKN